MKTAFKNEIKVLTKLPKHQNVVSMVDTYENSVKAYIVLERAGEVTLEAQMKKEGVEWFDFERVKEVTRQLLTAVDFLHDNKIVHRDIKPDNVMLSLDPALQVKLIDFNIAHDLAQEPEIKGANGVREWSAPETRKFLPYDEKCDLYSVGCILHYLCTGVPPSTDEKTRQQQLDECASRFSDCQQTSLISDLLTKLLESKHFLRHSSKEALRHNLFN